MRFLGVFQGFFEVVVAFLRLAYSLEACSGWKIKVTFVSEIVFAAHMVKCIGSRFFMGPDDSHAKPIADLSNS